MSERQAMCSRSLRHLVAPRYDARPEDPMDLQHGAALGVAGNMTGHLEQAGEAGDFTAVKAAAGKPKGMFPIYLPGIDHRLGTWPFSPDTLRLPDEDVNVQPEPEVALRVQLTYDEGGVCALRPLAFAAADDTSLRKPAERIHHKKNWGPAAKGLSETWIELDGFEPGGALDRYRLACFLVRAGECLPYGEDSAVRDYGTHHGELVAWMVDRLRHQQEGGPLDHIAGWLDRAGRPAEAVVCIGATRYTAFGERTFVQPGDEVVVVVYDGQQYDADTVRVAVDGGARTLEDASVLRRRVVRE